jgi:hypothetical protein
VSASRTRSNSEKKLVLKYSFAQYLLESDVILCSKENNELKRES